MAHGNAMEETKKMVATICDIYDREIAKNNASMTHLNETISRTTTDTNSENFHGIFIGF